MSKTKVTINIDKELKKQLKIYAAENDKTVTEIITELITNAVCNNEK